MPKYEAMFAMNPTATRIGEFPVGLAGWIPTELTKAQAKGLLYTKTTGITNSERPVPQGARVAEFSVRNGQLSPDPDFPAMPLDDSRDNEYP
jgi:hypothetical protein